MIVVAGEALDDQLSQRVERLLERGGRILGIAGAPGAGKSTLAARLAEHFGTRAALLPMDGFHLADDELTRRGSLGRKGAPDTFDVEGYTSALRRVRARDHPVMVPRFDRHLEAAIAGSICIQPEVELVITDGNYLLLDMWPWSEVAPLLDDRWMLRLDGGVRVQRLIDRHQRHGRPAEAARRYVAEVDEVNASLIEQHSVEADLDVQLNP